MRFRGPHEITGIFAGRTPSNCVHYPKIEAYCSIVHGNAIPSTSAAITTHWKMAI